MQNARQIAQTVFAILHGLSVAVLTRNYFPEESCFPKTCFIVRMWSEMNGKTPTDSELQRFTKLFPITSIPIRKDNENHSEENFSGILYGSSIDYWTGCLGLVGQTGGCFFF